MPQDIQAFDIAIAGEINLDLILYGLPRNLPTERELIATDFRMTLGSSSAILAHNLAVLGARVGFITRLGTDELGAIALARLAETGVDVTRVVFDNGSAATGVTVLLSHGKERHILTYLGAMSSMTIKDLDTTYLHRARHFHLSSLFLQRALAPGLPQLFRQLKEAGLTISLDTNDDPEDQWAGVLDELLDSVDILLPNEAEACRMTGRNELDDALAVLASRVPCVAVKRGPNGSLAQAGEERIIASPIAVTPVDTIGAGDSFNAGFLFAWLRKLPLATCLHAGNVAGALSTLRPGGTEAFRDRKLTSSFLKQHGFPTGC